MQASPLAALLATPAPFRYFDKGSMATIGHRAAVANAFGMTFTVLYLIGWGNRLGTLYTWARALWFSRNRGHRIITFERASEELAEGTTRTGRPAPILPRTRPGEAQAVAGGVGGHLR